jgi:Killing trait
MSENSTDNNFDAAATLDTLALGVSPSQSLAMLSAVMAQTLGMAMYNAVGAQQNASTVRGAAITMACAGILSLPIAETDKHSSASASAQAGAVKPALDLAAKAQGDSTSPTPGASASAQAGATAVDAVIADAINQIQLAVMSPQSVRTSGAGKAYQLVAHSAALAVQDAANALSGMSTIAATASGVALTRFLTTGDPKYLAGVAAAVDMVKLATDDFARVSAAASAAVNGFPSG